MRWSPPPPVLCLPSRSFQIERGQDEGPNHASAEPYWLTVGEAFQVLWPRSGHLDKSVCTFKFYSKITKFVMMVLSRSCILRSEAPWIPLSKPMSQNHWNVLHSSSRSSFPQLCCHSCPQLKPPWWHRQQEISLLSVLSAGNCKGIQGES